MSEYLSVSDMPKTSTFQMRINPEVKAEAENTFSRCGLTLTEAVNIFIQQSINAEGLPFAVSSNPKPKMTKQEAIKILMKELKKGEECEHCIPIEEAAKEFGVKL